MAICEIGLPIARGQGHGCRTAREEVVRTRGPSFCGESGALRGLLLLR